MMTQDRLNEITLGRDMDVCSATEVVNWSWDVFGDRLVILNGFAADDMVLLDMLSRIGATVNVAIVDTGRLLSETHDFIDTVKDRYRPRLTFYFPDAKKLQAYLNKNSPNAFRLNHDLRLECCEVRRHEPLRRAIKGYDAWMAGLRRSQSGTRQEVKKVEMDPVHEGIVKISPLADWSWEQVWAYAKEHAVPMHPLYDKGYMSIGCAPCNRPCASGDERGGRWWWEPSEQREDGIHIKI